MKYFDSNSRIHQRKSTLVRGFLIFYRPVEGFPTYLRFRTILAPRIVIAYN